MKKYIILLIITNALFSCIQEEDSSFILMENFTVPQENHPEWSVLFSENIKITPLETTALSLIGAIDKIKKFKGDYYICSSNGRTIHRFNQEGKFVTLLDRQGQGPEEYHRIEDFDVYEIDGSVEVWISDNHNLKVYDVEDFSYKNQISFPFIIHKFKRLNNSHVLLVTGLNDHILTLANEQGEVISEYLEKEIPFLMFRPVQFITYNSYQIFQLGISNAFVALDINTDTFLRGRFTNRKGLLTEKQLLDLFESTGMDFIRKANEQFYISNIIPHNDKIWIHTSNNGRNFITQYSNEKTISTEFLYGSIISTISTGESDDSILLYADAEQLAECNDSLLEEFKREIGLTFDDNPSIIEFF